MKTIEQQLDDMLPKDFRRQRRLAAARIEYYKNIGTALRKIHDAHPTALELAENIKANLAELRKQNQSDNHALDNKP